MFMYLIKCFCKPELKKNSTVKEIGKKCKSTGVLQVKSYFVGDLLISIWGYLEQENVYS